MTRKNIPNKKKLSEAVKRDRRHAYKKEQLRLDITLHMTECICPKCGKKHEVRTYYTGKEPMRKFCFICNGIAEADYSDGQALGY